MAQPQITWYDDTNATPVASWPIGTVDAGTSSEVKRVLIWNNRDGDTPLSDMLNCVLTTKDTSGGDTTEVVTGKWIQVQVNSAAESAFTAVGGSQGVVMTGGLTGNEHAIKAGGAALAGVISGAANDGTKGNAVINFADVSMKAAVPLIATAGSTNFLVRVAYQYI